MHVRVRACMHAHDFEPRHKHLMCVCVRAPCAAAGRQESESLAHQLQCFPRTGQAAHIKMVVQKVRKEGGFGRGGAQIQGHSPSVLALLVILYRNPCDKGAACCSAAHVVCQVHT